MKTRSLPLSELVESTDPGFASGENLPDGVVQLRMNNVRTDGTLDWSTLRRVPVIGRSAERYALKSGDVVFNSTNSPDLVGKTALFQGFKEPVVFSNHFLRIRVKRELADPGYIAWWLNFRWQQRAFESLCTRWVNQASVRKDDLLDMHVELPVLPAQQRIARLLEQADRLRRTRRYALELSDTFLPAAFLELFGDPRKTATRWDAEQLENLGTLDRGRSKHRPRNAPHLYGGSFPFIQTGDVANAEGYIRAHTQTYSEDGLKQSKLWAAGTLCITIAANIGETAILTYPACFPDSIVGFVPGERVKVEFVQFWLQFLQETLEKTAPEVAQKNINLEILRELRCPVPPLPLQQKFAAQVERHERLRANQREALRQADHFFQSLLHRIYSTLLAV